MVCTSLRYWAPSPGFSTVFPVILNGNAVAWAAGAGFGPCVSVQVAQPKVAGSPMRNTSTWHEGAAKSVP